MFVRRQVLRFPTHTVGTSTLGTPCSAIDNFTGKDSIEAVMVTDKRCYLRGVETSITTNKTCQRKISFFFREKVVL